MQKKFSIQVVLVVGVVIAMLFPTLSQADTLNDLKDIGSAIILPAEDFNVDFPAAPEVGVPTLQPATVSFPSVPEIGILLLQPATIELVDDTSQDNSANEVRNRYHRHNSYRRRH